jgi:uncharacterized membrane protein
MSNPLPRIIPLVLAVSVAGAAVPATASAVTTAPAKVQFQQARFGGGLRGFRRPSLGSRYRTRSPFRSPYRRGYRRPSLFRGILHALGIAFLLHALFGWGAGGSPFGLLLVVAFIAWLVTRRRRRAPWYA